MNTSGAIACLLASVLALPVASAQDQPPEWPQRELKFEVVAEPCDVPAALFEHEPIRPQFVASFAVASGDRDNQPLQLIVMRPNERGGPGVGPMVAGPTPEGPDAIWPYNLRARLFQTASGRALSEEQRKFVETSKWATTYDGTLAAGPPSWVVGDPARRFMSVPAGSFIYLVFAVSENDARLMAQAGLEVIDRQRRESLEFAWKQLLSAREFVEMLRAEVPGLQDALARSMAALEEAKQKVSYKKVEEAQQDIPELDKVLRSIDIEVTGIRAKIEAARRHKSQADPRDEATLRMLDRVLAEEDINLAGALARRNAVETYRKNAQAFCEASPAAERARVRRFQAPSLLEHWEREVPRLESQLKDPPPKMRPVPVIENKVIIQRIK